MINKVGITIIVSIIFNNLNIVCGCCCKWRGKENNVISSNEKSEAKKIKTEEPVVNPVNLNKDDLKNNSDGKFTGSPIEHNNEDNEHNNSLEYPEELPDIKIDIIVEENTIKAVKIDNEEVNKKNFTKENCKDIINEFFCDFTYIYEIKKEIFGDFYNKNHKINGTKDLPRTYLIAAVECNNQYYFIICNDPNTKEGDAERSLYGLFDKSKNTFIKYLEIGEGLNNFNYLMYDCSELKYVFMNNLDTKNVQGFCSMFHGCIKIDYINLSQLNINEVAAINGMFDGCNELKTVYLPNFNKIDLIVGMFKNCFKLESVYCYKENKKIYDEIRDE